MPDSQTIIPGPHHLEVKALGAKRGDASLFSDLGFKVTDGEVLFLTGANGTGKTSLLYILAGLRMQDEGEVRWCSKSIDLLGKEYQQDLCFVGHQNGIKAELTVFENLAGFRLLKVGNDENTYDDQAIVDMLNLGGYEDTLCYQLSSGQQRRLSLARLIGSKQPLWILDEPFTALDKKTITFFEQQIVDHAKAGGITVITSHQPLTLDGCTVKELKLDNTKQ